jgi:type 1 glutamine amidotransferase
MVTGGDDYPFAQLTQNFAQRLTQRGQVNIDLTSDPARLNPKKIGQYDVLFFNPHHQQKIAKNSQQAIIQHLKSGKGLVAMEGALFSYRYWNDWSAILGAFVPNYHQPKPYALTVHDPQHEITLGLGRGFEIFEEPPMIEKFDIKANVLIRTTEYQTYHDGKKRPYPEPLVWTKKHGQGRIFVSALGHNQKALTDERLISIIHNGTLWAARRLPPTPHNHLTKTEKQEGYQLLFNGKDTAGWTLDPKYWSVEDGELVGRTFGMKMHLYHFYDARQYRDFILKFSVKLRNSNSGVQFRSRKDKVYGAVGYQADIANKWWGGLFETGRQRFTLVNGWENGGKQAVIRGGWNDMTVKALGPKITITLNGVTTCEYRETDPQALKKGKIALQLHQGWPMEVRFRDLKILPLEKKP